MFILFEIYYMLIFVIIVDVLVKIYEVVFLEIVRNIVKKFKVSLK